MNRLFWLLMMAVLATVTMDSRAEVRLPAVIGDNMVLQQGKRLPIWGWAAPGETVTVTIAGQTKKAVANAQGQWRVKLEPLKTGEPLEMKIQGKNALTLKNILVGEVWVCSGQSNMQYPLIGVNDHEREIAQANYPQMRLFSVPAGAAAAPASDVKSAWVACSPQTVPQFTAIGYFFGRALHRDRKVPVGLINSSYGGSVAEAWLSREGIAADPLNKPLLDYWDKMLAEADTPAGKADFKKIYKHWQEEKERNDKTGGLTQPPPTHAVDSPHRPYGLYNAMIAPLVPFAIAGAIWYQGEANTSGMRLWSEWYKTPGSPDVAHADRYRSMLTGLIQQWRKDWGEGNFPFLIVQLPNCGQKQQAQTPRDSNWGRLREAQLQVSKRVPKTAIAVTLDTVFAPNDDNTGHPKDKVRAGERLALAARAVAYGEKIPYRGPTYKSLKVEGNKLRLKFDHVEGGLVAKGDKLNWFTVAGADRKFEWADAVIDGDTVVVSSPKVAKPVAVRYGWDIDPSGANLYNKVGLPATPFRTDKWPLADAKTVEGGNL